MDVDDTSSYGPETITIHQPDSTEFVYFVHNYSGEAPITQSNAKVVVYSGNRIIGTFNVPTSGTGRYWDVFSIKGDQITPINTIADE